MRRPKFTGNATAAVAAAAMIGAVFAGPVAAEENPVPAADSSATAFGAFDTADALRQLRDAATGNSTAVEAIERLLAAGPRLPGTREAALPAQVFQIPANADIDRTAAGPGVHGSGIALGTNGFQLGYFGGPGTIAPNQEGARLEAVWLNLANGRSGTELLVEHEDKLIDTTIRSHPFDPGPGPIVAAVYGTIWHRWQVPVDADHPDGYHYALATIDFPSLGFVYN
ncbi:MAG TPA: hypothetical protein VK083_13535 [Nocardia sp.]|uniref:hypothetical protein n=1 Tax=Nocardia sp. TaxID=1821 RepID=UPI002B4ABD98|nr:hypothetical protein [Nocardia sp.]HLS77803.1 hypothetical protein [Nocardia sp.]